MYITLEISKFYVQLMMAKVGVTEDVDDPYQSIYKRYNTLRGKLSLEYGNCLLWKVLHISAHKDLHKCEAVFRKIVSELTISFFTFK